MVKEPCVEENRGTDCGIGGRYKEQTTDVSLVLYLASSASVSSTMSFDL